MSRSSKKVRDRRFARDRVDRRLFDPRSVIRFRAPSNDTLQDPRAEAQDAAVEQFLVNGTSAIAALLEPHWNSPRLAASALFITDNSHDNGIGAIMAGADPRQGAAQWLPLQTAFEVAKVFSTPEFAAPLVAYAPTNHVRMVIVFRGLVAVKVWPPDELRRALANAKWMRLQPPVEPEQLGEELFEYLVDHDPPRLLGLLRDDAMDPTLLTFAAETAGRIPGPQTVEALIPLAHHPKAYVREGVTYALALHLDDARARRALRALAEDASPGVRAAATEQLAARDA